MSDKVAGSSDEVFPQAGGRIVRPPAYRTSQPEVGTAESHVFTPLPSYTPLTQPGAYAYTSAAPDLGKSFRCSITYHGDMSDFNTRGSGHSSIHNPMSIPAGPNASTSSPAGGGRRSSGHSYPGPSGHQQHPSVPQTPSCSYTQIPYPHQTSPGIFPPQFALSRPGNFSAEPIDLEDESTSQVEFGIPEVAITNRGDCKFLALNLHRILSGDPQLRSLPASEKPTIAFRMMRCISTPPSDPDDPQSFSDGDPQETVIRSQEADSLKRDILKAASVGYDYRRYASGGTLSCLSSMDDRTCGPDQVDRASR